MRLADAFLQRGGLTIKLHGGTLERRPLVRKAGLPDGETAEVEKKRGAGVEISARTGGSH